MIREFIVIFKNAYKEYYKERLAAKTILEWWKSEMIYFKTKKELAEKTLKNLSDLYLILPKKVRNDCVQKTIDLIEYGYGSNRNLSYIKQLNAVYEHIKESYYRMKEEYNKKNYSEVVEHAKYEENYLKDWYNNRDI